MKQLLLALLIFASLSGFGQAKRVYFVGDNQIVVASADGSLPYLRDVSAVSVSPGPSSIVVATGAAIYSLAPSEFLTSSGSAYGTDVASAMSAFFASKPVASGGSGTVTLSQTATFGTTPPSITDYTTSSGTITTTNVFRLFVENTGTASGTLTYGGTSYTLASGDQREFIAYTDPTSGKLVPYLTLSVNGTGTNVRVTKFFKQ